MKRSNAINNSLIHDKLSEMNQSFKLYLGAGAGLI